MDHKNRHRHQSIKYLLVILALMGATPPASATQACGEALKSKIHVVSDSSITLSHQRFEELLTDLRRTLSGNLATVFRSEWKTKLTIEDSNSLIDGFTRLFLSPETRAEVLRGLDLNKESFTRSIHSQLFKIKSDKDSLKKANQSPLDRLTVRDAPPPEPATDTTFTFYLRPLVDKDGNGEGKHQVRIRNYVRTVKVANLTKLPVSQSITGFSGDGSPFSLQRIAEEEFLLGNPQGELKSMTLQAMKEHLGSEIRFFAPHGGKYKLEVKTALLDKISADNYPQLGGFHMVQKLDVSLSPQQVQTLFAPLQAEDGLPIQKQAHARLDLLETELITHTPANSARIRAVLNVLREGVKEDPQFLTVEGATLYHRSAFESDLGFQLTVDRRQKVFHSQIYATNNENDKSSLRSPMDIIGDRHFLAAGPNAARHVELKLPFYAIEKLLGLTYSDPRSMIEIQTSPVDPQLESALALYSRYVSNASHHGKFKFLLENGTTDDFD